jgi:hypothetical protein
MGVYDLSEIVAAHTDEGVLCSDCMTSEQWEDLSEDRILTEKYLEGDEVYFCDKCRKQLN